MSSSPTRQEMAAIQAAEARARLVAQNKEQARAHLLRIQLLLARQAIPSRK